MDSEKLSEALSFVWWNTSLAPTRGRESTPEQRNIAAQLVQALVADKRVDFIALGEVSPKEKDIFHNLLQIDDYDLLEGFGSSGRSRFDMLFLYKRSRLSVSEPLFIATKKGGRTFRVAQRIDISVSDAERPVHLFVSHWPSRLYTAGNNPDRHLLGIRLRDAVWELYQTYNEIPNVILLGDYNDEPFDNSLTEGLLSTRDKNLAMRKNQLLYNPFWRFLGAACSSEAENQILGGTYYHRDGELTRWRLFDQMIFSASFLGGGEWTLDERLTQLIDLPNYSQLLRDRKQNFDHAPILGVVRRI